MDNRPVVQEFITGEFWSKEYADRVTDDFTVLFTNAPPGMPQFFEGAALKICAHWLRRTVKNWKVTVDEAYNVKGDDLVWLVGSCSADTFWGNVEGAFASKIIVKARVKDGKLSHMRLMLDPLAFHRAAKIKYPIFPVDLWDPSVEAFLEQQRNAPAPAVPTELDMSPEAIAARIDAMLDCFRDKKCFAPLAEVEYSPEYVGDVWFLPPQVCGPHSPEKLERMEAWSAVSCTVKGEDIWCHSTEYALEEDSKLFFVELEGLGKVAWVGNEESGYYRNQYVLRLSVDDAGRFASMIEMLNPINKYNSINTSVPTFPYCF
mgnify:CR=1 FL=1